MQPALRLVGLNATFLNFDLFGLLLAQCFLVLNGKVLHSVYCVSLLWCNMSIPRYVYGLRYTCLVGIVKVLRYITLDVTHIHMCFACVQYQCALLVCILYLLPYTVNVYIYACFFVLVVFNICYFTRYIRKMSTMWTTSTRLIPFSRGRCVVT